MKKDIKKDSGLKIKMKNLYCFPHLNENSWVKPENLFVYYDSIENTDYEINNPEILQNFEGIAGESDYSIVNGILYYKQQKIVFVYSKDYNQFIDDRKIFKINGIEYKVQKANTNEQCLNLSII